MASRSWMGFSCIPNGCFTLSQANQACTYPNTDQALISSVDLCQCQPSSTIQHHLPARCHAADQAIQHPRHTTHLLGCVHYLESSNPEAELAFQPMWNSGSEFAGFDFDSDFDFFLRSQQSLTSQSFCCGFCCVLCPKSFPQRWKLNRHLKRHEKPFKCEVSSCRAAFALRKDLRRHVKEVHDGFASGEDMLKCLFPTCNFSSTRRDALKRHLQGVHGVEIRFGASTSPSALSEPSKSD
jgi:uncharacterized C2H2 Zn-finger protein